MPLSMKIQPIDFNTPEEMMRIDSVKPMAKSRLKRFFDFPSILRNSTVAPEETMRSNFNARTKTMEVVIKTKGQTRVSKPRAVAISAVIALMVDERNTHMNVSIASPIATFIAPISFTSTHTHTHTP